MGKKPVLFLIKDKYRYHLENIDSELQASKSDFIFYFPTLVIETHYHTSCQVILELFCTGCLYLCVKYVSGVCSVDTKI